MTRTEPNSRPELFDNWEEWRRQYAEFISLYNSGSIDRHELRKGFEILGYRGSDLNAELDHCLEMRGKG